MDYNTDLSRLAKTKTWLADKTFKVASKMFYQLWDYKLNLHVVFLWLIELKFYKKLPCDELPEINCVWNEMTLTPFLCFKK